ncbi:MAG: hypothetical protein QM653_01815 [Dysgonomonas sp.]|uniref:hypothetical protein n=1 Tax=Dysgonomonas sp. TaxID=1891233 RepID=UPI0039E3CD4B
MGMGWALNAGGSIIRIIKDIEDFNYTTIQRKIPNYIKRELASNGRLCDMISLFEGKSRDYRSDASPDIFIINGNNLNNKFYIEKDVTNRYIPQVIDGSKLIIETECKKQILDSEILNNVGFDIKDINKYHSEQIQFKSLASKTPDYTFFNVTNTDGLKYFFEDKDLGENIPMHTNTIMQELM